MSFFNPRLSALCVAALSIAASAAGAAAGVFVPRGHRAPAAEPHRSTANSSSSRHGPGWSQAQVKRMARKRRNVLRNKQRGRRLS